MGTTELLALGAATLSESAGTPMGAGAARPMWPRAACAVTVQPGDIVVADGDGVVVVGTSEVDAVRLAAEDRLAREQEMFERLA